MEEMLGFISVSEFSNAIAAFKLAIMFLSSISFILAHIIKCWWWKYMIFLSTLKENNFIFRNENCHQQWEWRSVGENYVSSLEFSNNKLLFSQ